MDINQKMKIKKRREDNGTDEQRVEKSIRKQGTKEDSSLNHPEMSAATSRKSVVSLSYTAVH